MRPRIALQRPLIPRIFFFQFLRGRLEGGVVVRSLVLTNGPPINRFRDDADFGTFLNDRGIKPLGVREFLVHKRDARARHLEPSTKPILRQIAFDAISLDTFRVHHQNCRRPVRLESFEVSGMFFNVGFEWNKVLVNEVRDFLI